MFSGKVKRNLATDEINDEQAGGLSQFFKSVVAFFVSIVFVVCMGSFILLVFAIKT